jgi:flagellar basal body-associated protein FliL
VKIEQLIVQHLYANKKVSLQGIGTIHLNQTLALPAEGDKDFVMPEGAVTFDYDLKAPEDSGLINFIVEKTRKIKPLATSDLESYSMLAKQFLNIGKPLEIEGIGTIQKNQAGIYEFIPGSFVAQKNEEAPKPLRSKAEEVVSFESETKTNNGRRNVLIVVTILVLLLAGLAAYYFLFYNKPIQEAAAMQTEIQPDTTTTAVDTSRQAAIDSSALAQPAVTAVANGDSNNFRIVLKEYPSLAAANKAQSKLTSYGHKLEIITVDSIKYSLAMPFTSPLSDTIRARDSLRRFFGGNPYVLIK